MHAAIGGELPVVAEDLGVITPEVVDLRKRHHFPGMAVLQFEAGEEHFALDQIDEECVCYTGTHDNDTVVGWFNGGPGDVRTEDEILRTQRAVLRHANGSPQTIHTDLIRLAFHSPARIAIALMQDYLGLGSEARLNTPGTAHDNWRWRMQEAQITPDLVATVRDLVVESNRA